MKRREPIEAMLRKVAEPARSADYWREFPEVVANQVRSLDASPRQTRSPKTPAEKNILATSRWIAGIGFPLAAALSLYLIPGIGWGRREATSPAPKQFATVELEGFRRIFLELRALFPGQLQGVVFEDDQTHLVLSESANAVSKPLEVVQICRPDGCFTVVTTAGQPVPVRRGVMDVLPDAAGHVLVVGPDFAWRSGEPLPSGYTIVLSPLEVPL